MKKVYILLGGWDYEGESILYVFDSMKKAEEQKKKEELKKEYDNYDIQEEFLF